MWSFQSFPVLDGRHTCRGCQRLAKTQKQLFPLQYSTFFPRKVFFTCKLERKLCLPAPDRKVFCMVQTENVPDLAEERSYEILEEKHLPDSKLCIHVQVNGSETKRLFEKHLNEYSKTTVVPGFRKGKVPRPVLINQVGAAVATKACKELIQDTVRQVLVQEKYTPLSKATLNEKEEDIIRTFEPGKPLFFQFTFEAYPTVSFKGDYKGLHLRVNREEFHSSMVENTLVELQERNAELVAVSDDSVVGQDHVVVVDIKAWHANSDGTKGASLSHLVSESEAEVDMKRGNYMSGFKEGLLGARVGETVSIPLTFPDNAKRQDLRGISAIFDITIQGLKRRELPPLDDSLVRNNTKYSSLQELREVLSKELEREVEKVNDRHLEQALEDSLAEIVELEVPQQVAEEHSQRKFANILADMKDQGVDEKTMNKSLTQETYKKYKEETWTATLKELKVWFALQEIAKREQLKPSDEEIAQELDKLKEEMKEKDVDWEAIKERIETDLQHSKTMTFLKDNAHIEYVSNA